MPVVQLRYQDRSLRLFKSAIGPDLSTRTILVADQWDYVEMWLKRNGLNNALFFWRQAEDFAKASKSLPHTSSPLTPLLLCNECREGSSGGKGNSV